MNSEQFQAFVKKHKVPLIVGGVVLAVVASASSGEQSPGSNQPPTTWVDSQGNPIPPDPTLGPDGQFPVTPGPVTSSGDGGLVDMDDWREKQERDDIVQEQRIDTIYERETCVDPDTGEETKESIHTGC